MSTRPPAPRTVLRQSSPGSMLHPPSAGINGLRKKRPGGPRIKDRQQRVEEPGVPSDPPGTTYPVCMCAHSSTAGARICAGACACSASTWHCVPRAVCVHLVGASVHMSTHETLPIITIGPPLSSPSQDLDTWESCSCWISKIWMESLMFQVGQGSSKRVSHDCQNAPSTPTSSTLTETCWCSGGDPWGTRRLGRKKVSLQTKQE